MGSIRPALMLKRSEREISEIEKKDRAVRKDRAAKTNRTPLGLAYHIGVLLGAAQRPGQCPPFYLMFGHWL